MPAADPRLADFLEWAKANGLEKDRIEDYRRIAVELFGMSTGKRVTESHILRMLDLYSEGAGGKAAAALIEDVGETLLRYEAARRLNSGVTPLPPRTPASEPFTVRPDERVASDLRPPASSRDTGPEKRVVSFTGSGTFPATGSGPHAAPSLPAPSINDPRSVTLPRSRPTGSQFRCRKCLTMVTASEGGLCPRCGTAAPRVSSGQVSIATKPPRSNLGSWALPVVLGAIAFILAFQLGPNLIDRLRESSEPAGGTTTSAHLGVRLTLPDGWRHSTDGDRAPSTFAQGLDAVLPDMTGLRSSRFYRGSSREPEAELILTVAPRAPGVTEEIFRAWADHAGRGRIQTPIREISGKPALTLERCSTGGTIPGRALRCSGHSGKYPAVIYVWPPHGVLAVAVYLGPEGATDVSDLADEVIASLDLG